jgi:hypothetical protein
MVFTIISTFYFFKDSYSHMVFLQVLIQLITWSYWMQIMSQKFQSLPLIYLKERSEWIVNHIHLHLFSMYQTNYQVSLITFHPYMNRFNIIWSLGFGQVHIQDNHNKSLHHLDWPFSSTQPPLSNCTTPFSSELYWHSYKPKDNWFLLALKIPVYLSSIGTNTHLKTSALLWHLENPILTFKIKCCLGIVF